MNIKYPAVITEQEEGGFFVSFPDMDEAFTEGDTLDEAVYNAADVLTLTIESRVDEGMPVPEPSVVDNAVYIAPSSKVQAALLVRFSRETVHCPIWRRSWKHLGRPLPDWRIHVTGPV